MVSLLVESGPQVFYLTNLKKNDFSNKNLDF